jgi:hypothetical protein
MRKEDTAETTKSATGQSASAQPIPCQKSRMHEPVLPKPERIEIIAAEIAEIIPVQMRAA